jgi:broad specificity phosphatase PhoE
VSAREAGLLQLYLVRHGQTAWSLSGQHTGRTDVPMTERGEDEARALGPLLRALTFTRVLTSPRQRAWRTVDIRKGRPDWNVFRDGCPGGEMPAQVSDRADRLIARFLALDGNVALFSHGQFGCVLAARWIGAPVIDAQHFALGAGSLGILGHEPHHPAVRVIALWNATPPVATSPTRPP